MRRTAALAASLAALLIADVTTAAVRSANSSAPTASTHAPGGPAALQLAAGRWVAIATPPIRICDPVSVAHGTDLYVVDYGLFKCPLATVEYTAATNTWRRLAPPPDVLGDDPSLAWAGDRLVAVAGTTGATITLSPKTDNWTSVGRLPSRKHSQFPNGSVDLFWTGSALLANSSDGINVKTYELDRGDRWRHLADIPHRGDRHLAAAPMFAFRGSIFAWAGGALVTHDPTGVTTSSYAATYRLTGGGWAPTGPAVRTPASQLIATTVDGAMLITGSACPALAACSFESGVARLVAPGTLGRQRLLNPPGNSTPYPYDIAAGADVVVVTYPNGANAVGGLLPRGTGPSTGSTVIYDMTRHAWLSGPQAPTTRRTQASVYWTRSGVVMLNLNGRGGWLLRPRP